MAALAVTQLAKTRQKESQTHRSHPPPHCYNTCCCLASSLSSSASSRSYVLPRSPTSSSIDESLVADKPARAALRGLVKAVSFGDGRKRQSEATRVDGSGSRRLRRKRRRRYRCQSRSPADAQADNEAEAPPTPQNESFSSLFDGCAVDSASFLEGNQCLWLMVWFQ
jgi:hypothetical protein